MELAHRSVLLEPTVSALIDNDFGRKYRRINETDRAFSRLSGVFVDGTFGRGGHSRRLLSKLTSDARLVAFDKDPQAVAAARELAEEDRRVYVVHGGFAAMDRELAALNIDHVSGVMLDLGVSSPQIDDAERGFSFMREGPLDMRMDTSRGVTAAEWLADASVDEIKEVIAKYGEERFAFKIAKAIVARRESRPMRTTLDLAELVASVVRTREKGQHPATRTFQALRIYLNEELEELAGALAAVLRILAPGGRLAVISFHSLEDRMVKQCIAAASRPGEAQARLPIRERDMPQPVLESLGRVLPRGDEIGENVRARSAVLRVAERTSVPLPPDQGASFINTAALVRRAPRHAHRGK
jgi:16S rRNA (cytosine1402-N4)-methyltransferase